jgi:hypothetical protein
MNQKKAHKRYMRICIPSMIIYVLGVFGIAYLRKHTNATIPVLAFLTLIPAGAVISWIWGHWRYVSELDEFLQKLQFQAIMAGLGILLSGITVWGLLEELVKAPNFPTLPVFWILPAFFLIYGICFVIIGKRHGVKGVYL